MKKALTISLLLVAAAASAQTTPEDFLASYRRQTAAAGPAGLGVKGIIEDWRKAWPDDTLMLRAVFTYNLAKGRAAAVVTRNQKKYLGREAFLTLKDSTGLDVYYFEVPVYDDACFAEAQRAVERAIVLAPANISYRFDRISSLLDYEGGSPDMAVTAILDLVDFSRGRHPAWNYDGEPFGEDDFADAMKDYCYVLWNYCTPEGYESFYLISEKMHHARPKDPGFLDNMGAYWQVVRKNPRKASAFYKKDLKLDPDDYAAKKNLQIIDKTKAK